MILMIFAAWRLKRMLDKGPLIKDVHTDRGGGSPKSDVVMEVVWI